MKINFVCLHVQESTRSIPLGAAMIAANAKKHFEQALSIQIIDCALPSVLAENCKKITANKPECVCFSLYLWNVTQSLALIDQLKKEFPEMIIIVGGPQASVLPDVFADIPAINYIVTGEAEESIIPLFQALMDKKQDIPRITRQNKMPDLQYLPSPYLTEILDLDKYKAALWELSRGCPFNCAFCYESRQNRGIRRFPINRIKKELQLFQTKKIQEVFVLDPTFNYNKAEAKEILKAIAEVAPEIHFSFEVRAEFLDQEMTNLFSRINCSIQIGLQSIHPKVLKKINRSFSKQEFTEKVFLLHEADLTYGFDLIFGLPGDNLTGFLESLDYAFSLSPNHVDIFPLTVLPGTELFEQAKNLDLNYQIEKEYKVSGNKSFSPKDLEKAENIADLADLFYNQGKAVSWFDLILPYLNLSASEFFSLLATQQTLSQNISSPLEYQQRAIDYIFTNKGLTSTMMTVKCLITYFWHSNSVFSEESMEIEIANGYILNPDLQMAIFDYNPLAIIQLIQEGINDFSQITQMIKKQKTRMLIYAFDYSIEHYICSEEEYSFISRAIQGHGRKEQEIPMINNHDKVIRKFLKAGIIAEK
ncbi:MAG: radical SAM protein [Spirochaetales bacterium]|nr:radical SAM protein [Spirochaetales bacterium]